MKGKVGTMASVTETRVLHSVDPISPNPTLESVIVSRKKKEVERSIKRGLVVGVLQLTLLGVIDTESNCSMVYPTPAHEWLPSRSVKYIDSPNSKKPP